MGTKSVVIYKMKLAVQLTNNQWTVSEKLDRLKALQDPGPANSGFCPDLTVKCISSADAECREMKLTGDRAE